MHLKDLLAYPLELLMIHTKFEPKGEIFTNYKLKWLNYNSIKESFEEAAVMERIQLLMENLDQREQ